MKKYTKISLWLAKIISKATHKVDPSIDNLAIDSKDRIFITNIAKNGIYEIDKKTGKVRTIVEGNLSWNHNLALIKKVGYKFPDG